LYAKDITIDYDEIEKDRLLYYYALAIALFTKNDTEIKHIVENNDLIHIKQSYVVYKHKSISSINEDLKGTTGLNSFHLVLNVENNYLENLFIRSLLRDDMNRILKDIERLNFSEPKFNRVFLEKSHYNNEFQKIMTKRKYKINPLEFFNIKKKTLYRLINSFDFKENKPNRIKNILHEINLK
jgi:hypothetical protein